MADVESPEIFARSVLYDACMLKPIGPAIGIIADMIAARDAAIRRATIEQCAKVCAELFREREAAARSADVLTQEFTDAAAGVHTAFCCLERIRALLEEAPCE